MQSLDCREQWSFEKKIKKARAKKNKSLADSLAQRRPNYRIDHLVKERQDQLANGLGIPVTPVHYLHFIKSQPQPVKHNACPALYRSAMSPPI